MDPCLDYLLRAAAITVCFVSCIAGFVAASGLFCTGSGDGFHGRHGGGSRHRLHDVAVAAGSVQPSAVVCADHSFVLAVVDVSVCGEAYCCDSVWHQGQSRGVGRVSSARTMGAANSEDRAGWRGGTASVGRLIVRHKIANWLNERGRAISDSGDIVRARRFYRYSTKMDTRWSVPWYNLGLLEKYAKNWEKSRDCNQRAAALDPEDEAAWWNLGIAATALHEWKEARRAWSSFGIDLPDEDGEGSHTSNYSVRPPWSKWKR